MKKKGSSKIATAVLILTVLCLVLSFAWAATAQVMLNNNEEELIDEADLVETDDAEDTSSKMNDQRDIKPDKEARILPDRYKKEIDRETSGISPSSISLGDAVDAPHLPWYTGGYSNWFGQTAVTYDGVDAAQSGPISHDQWSWMETSVTGPGTFTFYWKVSSEEDYDWLDFWYSTDGINYYIVDWISGEVDWHQKSYYLEDPITYYFLWEYVKDASVSLGSDCGWVDQVTWEPDEPAGYLLSVYGYNPLFDISITSSTGHGGATPYSYILDPGTSVTLTAPEYFGSGVARKKFSNWSGDVSSPNPTITFTMSTDRTVTANYVDDPVIGSIQINIEPAGSHDTGAQWRLTSITPSSILVQSSTSPTPPLRALSEVPDDAIENDVIFVKFKPEMASKLDQMKVTTANGGIAVTGISDIDSLNVRHNAKAFKSLLEPLYEISEASKQYRDRHRDSGLHLWYEIRIDAKQDIKKTITDYKNLDSVEIAEPVYKIKLSNNLALLENEQKESADKKVILQSSWTPNDPSFANQWHYHNAGQHGGTLGADIDLIYAWEIEKGNPDVIVAIVDEGIQYNHPDLSANMWPAIGPDGTATLPGDHGTHVAGTVAAVTNNNTGVAGIAGGSGSGNGVRLMSVDIFDGVHGYNHILVYAYQADNGSAISQNSWTFSTDGVWPDSTKAGIDYFNAYGGGTVLEGGLTIFAAGNQDSSWHLYPGYYNGVMAVAATNNQDIKASYSNYGTWVEISAPGGETDSVIERGVLSTVAGNGYDYYQGTSMACPHVSGVAALMVSHAPGQFSANDIRNMLKDTADNHYAVNPGYTGQLGSGRLNAYQALLRVQSEMTDPLGWRNSGEIISGLEPGTYTITFKDIAGWTKPADITVNVVSSETTTATGTYITLTQPPETPVLISPVHGEIVEGTSVLLEWAPAAGATHYAVWIYNLTTDEPVFFEVVGEGTSYVYDGLSDNEDIYAWSVVASNIDDGTWGDFAIPIVFIDGSDDDLLPPTLISPEHNANVAGTSVELQWQAPVGATHYAVWVYNLTTDEEVIFTAPIEETSYTLDGLADNGDIYAWSVVASNVYEQNWSNFAFPRLFVND